jgi:hypothetical protein
VIGIPIQDAFGETPAATESHMVNHRVTSTSKYGFIAGW